MPPRDCVARLQIAPIKNGRPNECIDYHAPKNAVTKWGIRTNKGKREVISHHSSSLFFSTHTYLLTITFGSSHVSDNDFNGDVVTTLYNHPGVLTIGDWPSYYDNGTVASNGGLPQLGNLTRYCSQPQWYCSQPQFTAARRLYYARGY